MNNRWTHSNTTVYNIGYHIIWCPKYRRCLLVDNIEIRLRELLNNKAKQLNCNIEIQEIMPDHVHIFIQSIPVHAPHFIVQQLKGYTSRILRKEFKILRSRVPTLWTRSYYCESVGNISKESIIKYIENQKNA